MPYPILAKAHPARSAGAASVASTSVLHALRRIELPLEEDAPRRQPIKVRRDGRYIPGAAHDVAAMLVGQEQHDIRF